MSIDIFSTRTMLAALDQAVKPKTFLLTTFFPGLRQFDTKHVDIDIIKGKRRLAPFVSPRMQGKVVEKLGYSTNTYAPPYIKPKMATTAYEILNRAAGEIVYQDNASPAQRAATRVGEELAELEAMIVRREEWMAAQVLNTGQVSVVGDGVDDVIDFQFPADHKVILTGTALWTDANSKPLDDFRQWRRKVIKDSGISPTLAIFGADVIDAFLNHDDVKNLLDTRRVDLGMIDPQILPEGVTYYGYIKDVGLDIYGYDEWYLDDNGDEQPMMPVDKILLGSTRTRNSRLYGAIQDLDAGADFAVSRYPKSWTEKDPSMRFVMLQSAPLVALLQPDAFMSIKAV